MLSMTGTFAHNIDAKGRLFVPAKLREDLGSVAYLTMSPVDKCLAIYPQETWDVFGEKFAKLPMAKSKSMRQIFTSAVRCEPDSQGRIIVPEKLRKYAGLTKEVMVLGVHNRVEIWDAQLWNEEEEEMTPEKLAALFEELED